MCDSNRPRAESKPTTFALTAEIEIIKVKFELRIKPDPCINNFLCIDCQKETIEQMTTLRGRSIIGDDRSPLDKMAHRA